MFNVGDKLEINPGFKGIAEIIGKYPAGQGGFLETHFEVMLAGYKLKLPESVLEGSGLFKALSQYTALVEETIEDPAIKKGVDHSKDKTNKVKKYTKKR